MPTSNYRAAVIADGPVLYAPLDSNDPTVELRTGNPFTAFNTPTAPAAFNDGYTFDDASSEYLYIAAEDCYDVGQWITATGEFSMECWIKTPSPTASGASRVFRWGWYGLYLQVYRFNGQADGYITAGYTDSNAVERNVEDYGAYFDNAWHHVVCTYDGTTLVLYVDGASAASEVNAQGITISDTVAQDGFGIARDGPFNQSYFDGTIDDVAIYNYMLTSGQVSAHYAATRTEAVGTDPAFGDPAGTLRTPPEGIASSFHAAWNMDADADLLYKEVLVDLRVLKEPTVTDLYFWALQCTFYADYTTPTYVGGAHTGLQWNSAHPGNKAINFGGYDQYDAILTGSVSDFPSTPANDNTRDFTWTVGQTYQFRIWISGPDLVAASVDGVLIRELDVPGVEWFTDVVMWSEVFAECSASSALVAWSNFRILDEISTPTGLLEESFELTYQIVNGCTNTNTFEYGNSVRQQTNTTRTNP